MKIKNVRMALELIDAGSAFIRKNMEARKRRTSTKAIATFKANKKKAKGGK